IQQSEERGFVNSARNVFIGVHYLNSDEKNSVIAKIENHFANKTDDWEVIAVKIPEEVRVAAEKNKQSMNQVLAKKVANHENEEIKSFISEEDNEVLQSFFNNKENAKITDVANDEVEMTD